MMAAAFAVDSNIERIVSNLGKDITDFIIFGKNLNPLGFAYFEVNVR